MTTEDENKRPKPHIPLKDRLSLSPEEASALTGIGLTRIRQATYSGSLVARKNGKNTVILPEDLKAWLKALPTMAANDKREGLGHPPHGRDWAKGETK
jgi:hypothetical protein